MMHIIALLAAVLNALAIFYKLAIICSICLSFYYYFKTLNQCFFIRHSSVSGWEIANSENLFHPVQIMPSSVITTCLIVLHYKMQNRKMQSALICKDALINDEYRALKVELKIAGLSGDNSA